MNELIQSLVSQLNINDSQAKGGVGILLSLAQSKLAEGDFSKIASVIGNSSQVQELIGAAPKAESAGGMMGMLGDITSALGVNTGSLGSLATLASSFKTLNMDSGIVQQFIPVVSKWIEAKGGDVAKDIIAKVLK